jgi:hypothetical protein
MNPFLWRLALWIVRSNKGEINKEELTPHVDHNKDSCHNIRGTHIEVGLQHDSNNFQINFLINVRNNNTIILKMARVGTVVNQDIMSEIVPNAFYYMHS